MKIKNGFIGLEGKVVVAFNENKFEGRTKIFNQKVENSKEKLEIEEDLIWFITNLDQEGYCSCFIYNTNICRV